MAGGKVKVFRFDTETYPIRPGRRAPKLVCLQYANDIDGTSPQNGPIVIRLRADAEAPLLEALDDRDTLLEAHHGAFDQVVTCAAFPHLTPRWFKALGQGRGRDTKLRDELIHVKNGTLQDRHPKGYFALAGVVKRRLGIEIDKSEDTWRLRYARLDGVPVELWPKDAYQYAYGDIAHLRDVSRVLTTDFTPADEWLQVATAFCLGLAQTWGFRVDPQRWEWVNVALLSRKAEAERLLEEAGLFKDGSMKQDVVRAAVERACARAGKPVPRTPPSGKFPNGQVKADAETCEELADYDPVLTQLGVHTTANKMMTTYLSGMAFGKDYSCGSRPNALVASGRTSWGGDKLKLTNPWWPPVPDGFVREEVEEKAGTNLQNFPREEGVRDLVMPRPRFWWLSVDYDSLELRGLAQVCLWICGSSRLAERYQENPNFDPHTELAATLMGVSSAEALQLKKAGDKRLKHFRQLAKVANFGYMGGLGAKRFVDYAKGSYGVEVTQNEAYKLKDAWFETWPEMRKYFEYVGYTSEIGEPVKQFVSNRIRGRVGFTDGCNTRVQGLAADGAKRALFAVSRACYVEPSDALYGSRLVTSIHDENCLEVPIVTAHEAALSCVKIMEDEMSVVMPDIPIRVTPALSTYWIKAAEPTYDANGRLIPWG
jgi:DNA polymerase I